MKKKQLIVAIAILVIAAGIGSSIAYFTSRDNGTSSFTVGTVKVSVEEPSWNPDDDHIIGADKSFDKDPQVTNESTNDAYIRMHVTFSDHSVLKESVPGDLNAMLQEIGSKWMLTGEPVEDTAADTITYTYVYQDRVAAGAKTEPVFTSVRFPADLDTTKVQGIDGEMMISVSADAVQAEGFDSAADAFAALDQ